MKTVLIIGGTRFVGRIVIEKLLETTFEYKITIFNRGISNKTLFQNEETIEVIYGDRETKDIAQLFNRKWDIVIDFMGYFPDSLSYMLQHMHQNIGRYIFISTISVYDLKNPLSIRITEKGKLLTWNEKDRTDTSWSSYGQRKIACEEEIQKYKQLDHIILRPSLIYGKYDYTDRFYYWLYKIKNEKETEIPDEFEKPVNYTFSEDFAKVIIHFMEASHQKNLYNVVTHKAIALSSMFNESKKWLDTTCTIVSVLKEEKFEFELPLWFPKECLEISSERLDTEFNLNFNSLEESLKKTVEYYDSLQWPKPANW